MHLKKNHEKILNFACDYLPLIVFFGCYKLSSDHNPLIKATLYLIITTAVLLIANYILTKRIAKVALFSAVVLGVFGGATVIMNDDIFIKMKPTILNALFAAVLFYGYFSKKPFISYIFGGQENSTIKLSTKDWLRLSLRWALFFCFLAVLNEVVWRNFSTEFWVKFKVFGMLPISILFTMFQIPFMMKNSK